MQFILYDRWGEWIAPMDGVVDWMIKHSTNADDSLTLTLAGNSVQPNKEDRIVWRDGSGWNECLIEGIDGRDDQDGRVTEVYATNSITELRRKCVSKLEGGATNSTLLNDVVDGTAWYVGTQGAVEEFKVEEVTALEALVQLAEAQEGIIKTDIQVDDYKVTKRTVSIVQPDTEFCGLRFDYGRNITSIERIIEEDDVYTRIIARGGSYTDEEHVYDPSIDDWLWKEVTKKYEVTVQDDSLLPYWGWLTKDGGRRHSEMFWNDETISNENISAAKGSKEYSEAVLAILRKHALKELGTYGPKISYKVDVELFGRYIKKGELAQVTDYKFDPPLRLEATCTGIEETPEGVTVLFGSVASTIADTILRQNRTLTWMTGESSSFYA